MAQYRSDFKHKSDKEVEEAVDAWQRKLPKKIEKELAKTTKKDRGIVKFSNDLAGLSMSRISEVRLS